MIPEIYVICHKCGTAMGREDRVATVIHAYKPATTCCLVKYRCEDCDNCVIVEDR